MSISSELILLNSTKQSIRDAIVYKGVTMADEDLFSTYPEEILKIPKGTGVYESNVIAYLEADMSEIIIPSGTTSITQFAFSNDNFNSLYQNDAISKTDLVIPQGVVTIGNSAFHSCNFLTSVSIPDTVTSIDHSAFYGCSGLTSITVEATVPPTLGNNVFGLTNDCPIYVPDNSVLDYQVAWTDYASRITGISNL